jgi:hypothetical protein
MDPANFKHQSKTAESNKGLWQFCRDYWPEMLSLLGGSGLALSAVLLRVLPVPTPLDLPNLLAGWPIRLFLPSFALTLFGGGAGIKRKASITDLQKMVKAQEEAIVSFHNELERRQASEIKLQQNRNLLMRLLLLGLAGRIGLTHNDRISVYRHNGEYLIQIGRFSKNPQHEKSGRSVYPDDQGCIGHAWKNGDCFESKLPNPNKPEYKARNRTKWSIPGEVIDAMIMKSRSLAVFKLNRSSECTPFAVVVFESVKPEGITAKIMEPFDAGERQMLVQWLEAMERFEPQPMDARKEGY